MNKPLILTLALSAIERQNDILRECGIRCAVCDMRKQCHEYATLYDPRPCSLWREEQLKPGETDPRD